MVSYAVGCEEDNTDCCQSCEQSGRQYFCTDDETGDLCDANSSDVEFCTCNCENACSGDDECPDALVCGEAGYCARAEGAECAFHRQCGPGRCSLGGSCLGSDSDCAIDDDCGRYELCLEGLCQANVFRFVMLRDLEQAVTGDYPGADIESVQLIKANGATVSAQTVEDSENPSATTNRARFPDAILGPPEPGCDPSSVSFYSMGGAGGWVIVGFGTDIIEAGDTIEVSELGERECGLGATDDDFAVSASLRNNEHGAWTSLGECSGIELCTILVSEQ